MKLLLLYNSLCCLILFTCSFRMASGAGHTQISYDSTDCSRPSTIRYFDIQYNADYCPDQQCMTFIDHTSSRYVCHEASSPIRKMIRKPFAVVTNYRKQGCKGTKEHAYGFIADAKCRLFKADTRFYYTASCETDNSYFRVCTDSECRQCQAEPSLVNFRNLQLDQCQNFNVDGLRFSSNLSCWKPRIRN